MICSTIQSIMMLLTLLPSPAKDTDRVLVVRNESSIVSIAVAKDYMQRRGVRNLLSVRCMDSNEKPENETIPWDTYRDVVQKPIKAYLDTHPEIDFIVLTKGIPIRIDGAPNKGIGNRRPSVDSTLASLGYDDSEWANKIEFKDEGFTGTAYANRYWSSKEPFSHAKFGGYLVTRLDGYTEQDAKALVTRALAAEQKAPEGSFLLDTCLEFGYADRYNQPVQIFLPPKAGEKIGPLADVGYKEFNADMQKAADVLKQRSLPVELDETAKFLGDRTGLAGYVSWGSNDKKFDSAAYRSLRFAPGALCDTAVSTSGRTFFKTTGGQSLIADLIAQGVTGVKGYTDEPFLTAIASPSILFDRYTKGWTLAESFYAASRFVGWEDVVLGDPLCRPYKAARK
jgi:uncharacterized protein (TIGR03790 family)